MAGDLSAHPRHALYWAFVAPFLYPALVILLAGLASAQVAEAFQADTDAGSRVRWMTLVVSATLVLGHMMHWAQKITGTPFAAPVRAGVSWCALAILGGPLLMFAVSFGVGLFQAGQAADWAYRQGSPSVALTGASLMGFSVFYFVLLKPLIEEIGFRAIGFGCLRDGGVGAGLAILLTSAGFTLIHAYDYALPALVPVFVLGVFFGWLRHASKSIAPPILAHMAVNFQALLAV